LQRKKYVSLTFGVLWFLGWISLFWFASSIGRDFKYEQSVQSSVTTRIPDSAALLVKIGADPIRYSDTYSWLKLDDAGFDISEDSLKYNNVSVRVEKSADSNYSANTIKYGFGRSRKIAAERADKSVFYAGFKDTVLLLDNGISIDKKSSFRGQRAEVVIAVPVRKRIVFDESMADIYHAFEIKTRKGKRGKDADIITHDFDFEVGVPYIMTENGLKSEGGSSSIKEDRPTNEVIKANTNPKLIAEKHKLPFSLMFPALGLGVM
jgi:hypothetical protein